MKPTMDHTGLWRVPMPGSRPFRTRQEAQEYCDFIEPPRRMDWQDRVVLVACSATALSFCAYVGARVLRWALS